MKVNIDMHGALIIKAESDLEAYALSKWFMDYEEDSSRITFGVDITGYKEKLISGTREEY